jgi:SAM-dependent methyltransferase
MLHPALRLLGAITRPRVQTQLTVPRAALRAYLERIDEVPGWLYFRDVCVFDIIDAWQAQYRIHGDILEVGVFMGRSAILLGYLCRDNEQLVVCDLFEDAPFDDAEEALDLHWYRGLNRRMFEANYLRFHATLPSVLQCRSAELLDHGLRKQSFRLVHIDGSHLFDAVRRDIEIARVLVGAGGVAVFDDILEPHAPGVPAAVWAAITHGDLIPLVLTKQKLNATWDASLAQGLPDLARCLDAVAPALRHEEHRVAGRPLLHVVEDDASSVPPSGSDRPRWIRRLARRVASR